jgi:hypothetical protein
MFPARKLMAALVLDRKGVLMVVGIRGTRDHKNVKSELLNKKKSTKGMKC